MLSSSYQKWVSLINSCSRDVFYLFYNVRFFNCTSPQLYSNSGLCQKLTNLHLHFTFLYLFEGSSLIFNRAPGFCTSDDRFYFLHCHRSLQVKPPLVDCAYAPSSPLLCSPQALEVQRYSSVREREMRGPFLISFLFSSFLLLFSSSLRIFWKASAV